MFLYLIQTVTFMYLADAFIQSDLLYLYSGYKFFVSMCSLGIKPTTFALLTQCSTTEPQEHKTNKPNNFFAIKVSTSIILQITWHFIALLNNLDCILPFKRLGLMFLKEISHVHQGCIYLIVKTEILQIKITFLCENVTDFCDQSIITPVLCHMILQKPF